jgi:hypothetical protein
LFPLPHGHGSFLPIFAAIAIQSSVSDEYLVGFVTRSWGTDVANQTPAIIEMQRRLMVEIKKFNRASTVLAGIVIFVACLQLVVAGFQLWIASMHGRPNG